MEPEQTSWKRAFGMASLAIYSPFVVLGLLGFARDADCLSRWWAWLPILPGLVPGFFLLDAPRIEIMGVSLHRMQPPWLSAASGQLAKAAATGPRWVGLLLPAAFTLVSLAALGMMFRYFPPREKIRWVVFGGGLACASLLAALAYAMFRA